MSTSIHQLFGIFCVGGAILVTVVLMVYSTYIYHEEMKELRDDDDWWV